MHTGTPAAADYYHRVVKENVAATSRRGLRDICWSRPDHKPRSLGMEIATALSWSIAALSERVNTENVHYVLKHLRSGSQLHHAQPS